MEMGKPLRKIISEPERKTAPPPEPKREREPARPAPKREKEKVG